MKKFEVEDWEAEWIQYRGTSFFGKFLRRAEMKAFLHIFNKLKLDPKSRIIDVGCGPGTNMGMFQKYGFENVFGLDNSRNALLACEKIYGFRLNKDTFLMDASKTKFKNNFFDLVFSGGMLEHFTDFTPFVKEICRISKQYILLFQPHSTSLFSKVKKLLGKIIVRTMKEGRVHSQFSSFLSELPYDEEAYVSKFERFGFKLIDSGSNNFGEEIWLLFEKRKKQI